MNKLVELITEYFNTHQAEYVAWLANKRRNKDGKAIEKASPAVALAAADCLHSHPGAV